MHGAWVRRLALAMLLMAQLPTAQAQGFTPSEGFWYDPERPGTGFSLEARSETVAMAFYHFDVDSGRQQWHLAVGALQGDVVEASLQPFVGGSCLGCLPFVLAQAQAVSGTVRLVFQTTREATLQVGDHAPRRVIALPYGVPYIDAVPTQAGLPLPDLRGRWLLGSSRDWQVYMLLQLDAFAHHDDAGSPTVVFTGSAEGHPNGPARVECADGEGMPRCSVIVTEAGNDVVVGEFRVGDIDEDRALGRHHAGGQQLVAWRIEDGELQP